MSPLICRGLTLGGGPTSTALRLHVDGGGGRGGGALIEHELGTLTTVLHARQVELGTRHLEAETTVLIQMRGALFEHEPGTLTTALHARWLEFKTRCLEVETTVLIQTRGAFFEHEPGMLTTVLQWVELGTLRQEEQKTGGGARTSVLQAQLTSPLLVA